MQNFSILDLAMIGEGETAADALGHSVTLARHAEALGFHRFWLAEHHNSPGIASSATALAIQHVAANTSTIRVGAGGIMLPNHAPLMVAEQFGTLATLYPGRIDLGLGRAPGTDGATAQALRRYMGGQDNFPNDVVELLGYLGDRPEGAAVRAIPGEGTHVPVWILGSSLFGAQLAAWLGLPYAFASHFAPQALGDALDVYRRDFRPSQWLDAPRTMVAVGVCGAESDDEAQFLRTSQMLAFARLRTGQTGKFPAPVKDISTEVPPQVMQGVLQSLSCSAVGSPMTVRNQLDRIITRYQPDEIIIAGMIHDLQARLRSTEIAAEALKSFL